MCCSRTRLISSCTRTPHSKLVPGRTLLRYLRGRAGLSCEPLCKCVRYTCEAQPTKKRLIKVTESVGCTSGKAATHVDTQKHTLTHTCILTNSGVSCVSSVSVFWGPLLCATVGNKKPLCLDAETEVDVMF